MSKIKITSEQERDLLTYKAKHYEGMKDFVGDKHGCTSYVCQYRSLLKFSYDEFARLLYGEGSYFVKDELKVGDIAVKVDSAPQLEDEFYGQEGYVFKVAEVSLSKEFVRCEKNGDWIPATSIRIAFPEEIEKFNMNEIWKSVKAGDVISNKEGSLRVFVSFDGSRIFFKKPSKRGEILSAPNVDNWHLYAKKNT